MTKPSVPTRKAKGFGAAPKAGTASASRQSRAPARLPASEAVTEPRIPFIRRGKDEPPPESARGDDDVMNQPQ